MSYFIIQKNCKSHAVCVLLGTTNDASEAFAHATMHDARIKTGLDDEQAGEDPKSIITIEDEEGNDKWQECSRIACPSAGLFNIQGVN